MSLPASVMISVTLIFSLGFIQVLGARVALEDDPIYQLWVQGIEYQVSEVEYKLNFTREIYINNTKTYNLPQRSIINSTLCGCFESDKANYTSADPDCMDFIEQSVLQVVADSESELDACTNLTHSWELIQPLIASADNATTDVTNVVAKMKAQGLGCLKYKKADLEKNCLNRILTQYSTQLNAATSHVHDVFTHISGAGLLFGAEATSCQNAEQFSFKQKCKDITYQIVTSCLPSTSTTTTANSTAAPGTK